MITLYYDDTSLEIQESESSYRYRALMEKPQLVLKFSLPQYIEFPVGTWCRYQNEKYSVWSPQNIKKNGERNIEYTITMGNDEQLMAITKLRNSVDNRLKFSMCAKPHEFIEEIVKSLNKKEGINEWTVGTCIDSTEKTVEFNHSYIDAALQSVADTFETEWEINNKKISLHKVEYFKEEPLPLSYGRGNGFIPGVGRTTPSGEMPIKRLYVQGGDKNIDRSEYGSAELLLPKGQTLEYEGRTYKSDSEGLYIERIDKVSDAVKEDSLDCSEIYPSRVGTVSSVECIDTSKNFYDFLDNSIPTDLNFNDYVIEGETATIIFQSGMLAGKEFEFKYKHAERRFELVPQEIDGQTMPNDSYKPAVNDTYAVFGIMLPQAYICNNTDKTGASWDMFREAARHLYENEDQKFTFTGTLQGLWAKRNWLSVGGKLMVGGYILFSDTQFAKEGQKIRITGIKDFIYSPYSPTIELSNSVSGSSVSSKLREIDNQDVVIDDTKKSILQFTKRRFRDAQETLGMLEKSLLNFSSSVNPITVQTMAMLVGDESLQFRFVESKENLTVDADWQVTYDNTTKQLHCPHGYLQHMTLGISSISSSHGASEYKVWEMGEYLSPVLAEGEKKYYLYAKVSREDTTAKGSFSLSENAIDMDAESGYYYLLVGVLNSELDEERSYVDLYGYTEVLPGRITTDKVVSTDGKSWLDLQTGQMKLGDKLYYDGLSLYLDFLFSEGANIGGWIFRNNRLESENGNVYFDGINGKVRLAGTIQLSTAYSGAFADANIFWLPAITSTKTIAMGYSEEHIGKVVRLYNSSNFNGAEYRIRMQEFTISKRDDGMTVTTVSSSYDAIVRPQEVIEVTCFEMQSSNGDICGHWDISSRFSQEMFINETDVGRFPRLISMGRMNYNSGNPYISGSWWNGKSISSKLSVQRTNTGQYRISFSSSDIPSGYKVIVSGYGAIFNGSNSIKAGVYETASTYFDVHTSDDASRNDGSFDFIIFAPNWEYKLTES